MNCSILAALSCPIIPLLDLRNASGELWGQKRKHWVILHYTSSANNGVHVEKFECFIIIYIYVSSKVSWSWGSMIFYFFNNLILSILRLFSLSLWPPGEPISVLDGVPIAIKDEIDCTPYPTTGNSMSHGFSVIMFMFSQIDPMVSPLQLII